MVRVNESNTNSSGHPKHPSTAKKWLTKNRGNALAAATVPRFEKSHDDQIPLLGCGGTSPVNGTTKRATNSSTSPKSTHKKLIKNPCVPFVPRNKGSRYGELMLALAASMVNDMQNPKKKTIKPRQYDLYPHSNHNEMSQNPCYKGEVDVCDRINETSHNLHDNNIDMRRPGFDRTMENRDNFFGSYVSSNVLSAKTKPHDDVACSNMQGIENRLYSQSPRSVQSTVSSKPINNAKSNKTSQSKNKVGDAHPRNKPLRTPSIQQCKPLSKISRTSAVHGHATPKSENQSKTDFGVQVELCPALMDVPLIRDTDKPNFINQDIPYTHSPKLATEILPCQINPSQANEYPVKINQVTDLVGLENDYKNDRCENTVYTEPQVIQKNCYALKRIQELRVLNSLLENQIMRLEREKVELMEEAQKSNTLENLQITLTQDFKEKEEAFAILKGQYDELKRNHFLVKRLNKRAMTVLENKEKSMLDEKLNLESDLSDKLNEIEHLKLENLRLTNQVEENEVQKDLEVTAITESRNQMIENMKQTQNIIMQEMNYDKDTVKVNFEKLRKKCQLLKLDNNSLNRHIHALEQKESDILRDFTSLNEIIECKNNELRRIRLENMELQNKFEEFVVLKKKLELLNCEIEHQKYLLEQKDENEKRILAENSRMSQDLEYQKVLIKRIQRENIELSYLIAKKFRFNGSLDCPMRYDKLISSNYEEGDAHLKFKDSGIAVFSTPLSSSNFTRYSLTDLPPTPLSQHTNNAKFDNFHFPSSPNKFKNSRSFSFPSLFEYGDFNNDEDQLYAHECNTEMGLTTDNHCYDMTTVNQLPTQSEIIEHL